MIILHKINIDIQQFLIPTFLKSFDEKASAVAENLWLDKFHTYDWCINHFH
ncbi:MAG: hypothetical protein ACFWUK_14030 [Serratia liquefaciens]